MAKNLVLFYEDTFKKRKWKKKWGYRQRDFEQNEIKKKLNQKHGLHMFSSKVRGGKAFVAEQNIREL